MHYELPLGEIVLDFFDQLKIAHARLRLARLRVRAATARATSCKLDILLAGEPVDALSLIVPRERAYAARQGAGREAAPEDPAAALRGADPGGDRQHGRRPRDGQGHAQGRARQVLRRRHHAQAQAAREAEGGQEADEAARRRSRCRRRPSSPCSSSTPATRTADGSGTAVGGCLPTQPRLRRAGGRTSHALASSPALWRVPRRGAGMLRARYPSARRRRRVRPLRRGPARSRPPTSAAPDVSSLSSICTPYEDVDPARATCRETVLWWVERREYLGRISIRHRLNDALLREGGNIGFEVRPGARRRGHATAMLAAALPRRRRPRHRARAHRLRGRPTSPRGASSRRTAAVFERRRGLTATSACRPAAGGRRRPVQRRRAGWGSRP